MSRRKSEIAAYMNERDFPHLVELELPAGGFRDKSQELESFHRERGIAIHRGRGRHEAEQFHVRFCFPDTATADAFQERFGPRVRHQRSYSPRIVRGKVMTPADLRRLHKYMLDIKKVTVISDEMRAVVEREWPELVHKLPPRG
jgi:hypothetical protein